MAPWQFPHLSAVGLHSPENHSHHLFVGTDFPSLKVSHHLIIIVFGVCLCVDPEHSCTPVLLNRIVFNFPSS